MTNDCPGVQGPPADTLFLHMGPGGSSYVERTLLGPKLPHVDFWDQPRQLGSHPWADLVKAVEEKVLAMAARQEGPVQLWTHSFGAHIAIELVRRQPQLIKSLNLCSPCWHIPGGFLRLLSKILLSNELSEELKAEIENSEGLFDLHHMTLENFWKSVGLVARVPDYLKFYFSKVEAYPIFGEIFKHGPGVDEAVFYSVLSDFFSQPRKLDILPWSGEVRLEIGEFDPMVDPEEEIKIWSQLFPKAMVHLHKNQGHFVHLESLLLKQKILLAEESS